jgi:hypothetical protein
LQGREIRRAVVVQCHHFSVQNAVLESGSFFRDRRKILRPVEALACPHDGFPISDTQLHAITIELDFMNPILAERRSAHPLAKLRGDEIRHL